MAKITHLALAGPLTGDEMLPVVQEGQSRRVSVADHLSAFTEHADMVLISAQALVNFRATLADGIADFPVGAYFSSAESGEFLIYERTAGMPGYTAMPAATTPITRKTLETTGPALIGTGPNGRTLESNLRERHNVRDFGAFGDNIPRPLSTFYATLAAAQVEFPAATSLDNLIDGLAINKALSVVADSTHGRGIVYAPAGRYRGNTGSLEMPNWTIFQGDGAGRTIIDNQSTPVNYALLKNRGDRLLFSTIEGISFHGGTIGIDLSGGAEATGLYFDDVSMALNSAANLKVGDFFQTSTFHRVGFGGKPDGATRGVWQTGSIANALTFDDCEFTSHTLEHLWLNSPENVRVRGGRFEAAGQPEANVTGSIATAGGVATLTVTAVANGALRVGSFLVGANVTPGTVITALGTGTGGAGTYIVNILQVAASAAIKGYTPTIRFHLARSVEIATYMEATHEYALVETDSRNGVKFNGTHFTGAYIGGADFIPYKFYSPGFIEFGSNDYHKPSLGPERMVVTGPNVSGAGPALHNPLADIWTIRTERLGVGVRGRRSFAAARTFPLVSITRSADSGVQMIEGHISVQMYGATAGGGLPVSKIVQVPFAGSFREGYVAEIGFGPGVTPYDPGPTGFTIALALAAGATNTSGQIDVQCSGANGAGQSYAVAGIEYKTSSSNDVTLKVEFA